MQFIRLTGTTKVQILEAKFRQFVRPFALDLTANDAARLTGLSRISATHLYQRLRQHLVDLRHSSPRCLQGTVEVDKSYFGCDRFGASSDAVPAIRPLCSVCSNVASRCLWESCPIARKSR